MNLPAHGTASPDPSKASVSVKNSTPKYTEHSVSAWPGPHAARRNCSRPPGGIHLPPGASVLPDPTVFSSPPGGAHLAARRHSVQRTPLLRPSPGGYQRTARHHTRTVLFWFMIPRHPKSTIYSLPKFTGELQY